MPDAEGMASPAAPELLVDCDPGLDDAIALLCAARYGRLVGVTTVSGNVGLARTTANALAVLGEAGIDVPVHSGADRPLVGPPLDAAQVHGESGLAGFRPTRSPLELASGDAVEFLVESIRAVEGRTLVALGPLTNIARLVEVAPDVAGRLAAAVVMGGSAGGGNASPAAEFNIWADPEAAHVVMRSPLVPTLVTLETTRCVLVGRPEQRRLAGSRHPAGRMAGDLIDAYLDASVRAGGPERQPLHDPCAVIAATHPELFESELHPIEIELDGSLTRGMTVVDRRPTGRGPDTARIVTNAEVAEVTRLILDAASGESLGA